MLEQTKSIYNTTQNTETETFKKPSDKLNTGSTIRTSTVPKWPHPKLGMTGGRKAGRKRLGHGRICA